MDVLTLIEYDKIFCVLRHEMDARTFYALGFGSSIITYVG
jgi:hypothetical protein